MNPPGASSNMTDEQIKVNRGAAANLTQIQLGLDLIPPSEWTYEQRTEYNKALASYIAGNPSLFSAQDLVTAKDVQNTDYGILQDTTPKFEDFISEVGNQVVSLNNDLNPFSEKNRKYVLISIGIGLFVYFVGPVLIEAFKQKTKE